MEIGRAERLAKWQAIEEEIKLLRDTQKHLEDEDKDYQTYLIWADEYQDTGNLPYDEWCEKNERINKLIPEWDAWIKKHGTHAGYPKAAEFDYLERILRV